MLDQRLWKLRWVLFKGEGEAGVTWSEVVMSSPPDEAPVVSCMQCNLRRLEAVNELQQEWNAKKEWKFVSRLLWCKICTEADSLPRTFGRSEWKIDGVKKKKHQRFLYIGEQQELHCKSMKESSMELNELWSKSWVIENLTTPSRQSLHGGESRN